jgi:hypothetical protein
MLKLSGFDVLFAAAGNIYLLLMASGIALALWKGKTWPRKLVYAAIVLALFAMPIVPALYRGYEYQQKLAKAEALFQERCKTAGEKIYRTVENVEGVFLLTIRKESNRFAQYELTDPGGDDAHDTGYIETFFMGKKNDFLLTHQNRIGSYKFVETPDSTIGGISRYVDSRKSVSNGSLPQLVLTKQHVSSPLAQFGVATEDISTQEDRVNWIAASQIKVIELKTKRIVAERVGYVFDRALGNTEGERAPWGFATYNACPTFPRLHNQYPHKWGLTRNFVEKVLKPIQGVQ